MSSFRERLMRVFVLALALPLAVPAFADGIADYTIVTINLQGMAATDPNGSKYTTMITPLLSRFDIVAIQEAGPVPGGTPSAEKEFKFTGEDGAQQSIWIREFETPEPSNRASGQTRIIPKYLYHMRTDKGGNRVNLITISKWQLKLDDIIFFPPQVDNKKKGRLGRPFFGIKLPNNSYLFNIHAGSYGNNELNDADHIVAAVASGFKSGNASWAIVGDFNREAANFNPPAGTVVINNGEPTTGLSERYDENGEIKSAARELDFMVARKRNDFGAFHATRGAGGDADHFPVEFSK